MTPKGELCAHFIVSGNGYSMRDLTTPKSDSDQQNIITTPMCAHIINPLNRVNTHILFDSRSVHRTSKHN